MNILFLPLDERPCNYIYPQMIASSNTSIHLTMPPLDILSHKKEAASFEKIKEYLLSESDKQEALVISLDMLLYGGLLPSRIHHLTKENLKNRLHVLKDIKEKNPQIKIYAFECIMRCPQYNSSEEEPDYYEKYGYSLFKKKYLEDKQERETITAEQEEEKNQFIIPKEILKDYEERRHINCDMNKETLKYLEEDIIDFLVIPQDDSSPFGYTAIDQKAILNEIHEKHLDFKVMVYPGADEVGLSLMTRAYNDFYHLHPKIYPFYASVLGPTIVPLYEDRPMLESLKSHILVTGAQLVTDETKANMILAINCPGKVMQESFDKKKDVSYSSYRQLMSFVERIKEYIQEGKCVGVIDSAYANGGDDELICYLDHYHLLEELNGYAGWNTNCNTTGTVLSEIQLGMIHAPNTVYRLIEDVFYQAKVRQEIISEFLPERGLSYYDFKDQEEAVEKEIGEKLLKEYCTLHISHKYPISSIEVTMPWHRMFEIGMKLK